jgi:hypothetical protein
MWQLEICRADGLPLISPPNPEQIEPFSLDYPALIEGAKAKQQKAGKSTKSGLLDVRVKKMGPVA